MTGHDVGYIRVSSLDQSTDRQLAEVKLDIRFEDKASGSTTTRPQLTACLKHLRQGDTLHVHSIDRLARNLRDLQSLVEDLTRQGITVRFHSENLCFTAESDPLQQLMLHLLGAVSQFERSLIRERQAEGIAAAKKKGKRLGARPKLSDAEVTDAFIRLSKGDSKKDIAADLGISRTTLYAYINRRPEQNENV